MRPFQNLCHQIVNHYDYHYSHFHLMLNARYDEDVPISRIIVGYEDRFIGVVEKPFTSFNWADFSSLSHLETAIPRHRIAHFKYCECIVWDRHARVDDVFGSQGGLRLHEAIEKHHAEHGCAGQALQQRPASPSSSAAPRPSGAARTAEPRPNYFVNWRIADPSVAQAVEAVQGAMCLYDPALTPALLPTAALHITLVTLLLQSPADVQAAERVMQEARDDLFRLMPPSRPVTLARLAVFRDRVLHVCVDDASSKKLQAVVTMLTQRFNKAGLALIGNRDEFTAHMTIAKLGRALTHTVHHISQAAYGAHADRVFGEFPLDGINLSKMEQAVEGSGYYPTVCYTPNVPRPVYALDEVLQSFAHTTERTLFIMRGLPGFGKSTFVGRLSGLLQPPPTVCSTDHFYETPSGYQFNLSQLNEAHASCRKAFDAALQKQCRFVVIDNTNVRIKHYEYYVTAARAAGYHVHILELACGGFKYVDMATKRCLHNV